MKVGDTRSSQIQGGDTRKTERASQAAQSAKAKAKGETARSTTSGDVNADISSKGKEFAKAKSVASSAPDVREEKIAELKRRIQEGKYKVDSKAVADKLVDDQISSFGIG